MVLRAPTVSTIGESLRRIGRAAGAAIKAAPTRGRSPAFGAGAADAPPGGRAMRAPTASVRFPQTLWRRGLVLPPAGNFSPQKSSQNAPGAAAPGPLLAVRRASPEEATRRLSGPIDPVGVVTLYPIKASRGPVESDNRCGYRTFLKGRTYCPGTGRAAAHGSFCARISRPNCRGGYQQPAGWRFTPHPRRRPCLGCDSRQC